MSIHPLAGRIQGKTALVTGVGYPRGIGMLTARRLAQEGAHVMGTDILESVHTRAAELKTEGLCGDGWGKASPITRVMPPAATGSDW